MLKVRAIKKYHDAKGILLGYTIQAENGETRDVTKDMLKRAVASGQVEVINMTLTSDGRFIGKAAVLPKKREQTSNQNKTGRNLVEVYTNGKTLVCGLVDETQEIAMRGGKGCVVIPKLPPNSNFDIGYILTDNITHCKYDNIVMKDGKPDLSNVKRKSFSKIKDKMIAILKECKDDVETTQIQVLKESNGKYAIAPDMYETVGSNSPLINIMYALIQDACTTEKIKVVEISSDSIVHVESSKIDDVRKAVKPLTNIIK